MRCRFFLLDVNEGQWEGEPCIRFWSVDAEGKRILILALQIIPYFYFLPSTPVDRDTIRCKLMQDKKFSKVLDLTIEHRKLLGKDQAAFKVRYSDPAVVSSCAKAMPIVVGGGQSFEDLRLPVRYVTDCGLTSCGWNECEVEPVEIEETLVERAYLTTSLPRTLRLRNS